jgi:uncharacterized coiled-coil DUF342 family protein
MTPEDAATLYPAIQKECDALEQRLCDLIKAHEGKMRLNTDWQRVADEQRRQIEELRREKEKLQHHAEVVQNLNDYLSERDDTTAGERVDFCVMRLLGEQREEIVRLMRDAARLEGERATLSAHLEAVATERDGLMQRVMELLVPPAL